MNSNWTWIGRYILVIVVALALGGIIGEFELFKQTTLGTPKMTAAKMANFLGYGGALMLFWLLTRETSVQLARRSGNIASLGHVLTPLATLVVVALAYGVLLILLKPFLGADIRNLYNWLFVLGITGSALWLLVAIFHHADSLMALFKTGAPKGPREPA